MARKTLLLLALALLALVALLASPVAAQGPGPELTLVVAPGAAVGKEVVVEAYLRDPAGAPIPDQAVAFSLDNVEFLNNSGTVQIGHAKTDEKGRALLAYTFKREGEQTITASFEGNGAYRAVTASAASSVAPGQETYEEKPPFRIPGANIVMVVTVLTATWGILAVVVALLWLVSRAGGAEASAAESGGHQAGGRIS